MNTTIKHTLKDFIKTNNGTNRYGRVRQDARRITSSRIQKCEECGYDKHVETCHVIPISHFEETDLIEEINSNKNLLLLCPNCHWERDSLAKKLKQKTLSTCQCGNLKYRYAILCKSCDSTCRMQTTPRKVKNRPSKEELKTLIDNNPYSRIGKIYDVSGNSIKKWAKQYNIYVKKNR